MSFLPGGTGFNNPEVVELDHATKQISKTLQSRLIPYMKHLNDKLANDKTISFEERAQLSSLISSLAAQMDVLWKDICPNFAYHLIVPSNIPPVEAPPPMFVMSRVVQDNERDCRFITQPSSSSTNPLTIDEQQQLHSLLKQHQKQVEAASSIMSTAQSDLGQRMRQRREQRLQEMAAVGNDNKKTGKPAVSSSSNTVPYSSLQKRKAEEES